MASDKSSTTVLQTELEIIKDQLNLIIKTIPVVTELKEAYDLDLRDFQSVRLDSTVWNTVWLVSIAYPKTILLRL